MNIIYMYEGVFEHGESGYNLVRAAAECYSRECGYEYDITNSKILREEKGKPYFMDIPIDFSITHSGQMWMCMFADSPCGIDLQIQRHCEYEKISKKHYTEEEQHYVKLWGLSGFYDVWVRKEAFCKCTGQGFFTAMPSTVDTFTNLCSEIKQNDIKYYIKDIDVSNEIKCAVCMNNEIDIEMRLLN